MEQVWIAAIAAAPVFSIFWTIFFLYRFFLILECTCLIKNALSFCKVIVNNSLKNESGYVLSYTRNLESKSTSTKLITKIKTETENYYFAKNAGSPVCR